MSTSLQAAAPNPKDLARAPGLFGQSVAWLAVAWGVLCVLAGVFDDQEPAGMAAMALVGLAFLIPSLWWLRCASKDNKAVKHYEDLSLIHISEPTRHFKRSRMPSSA